MNTSTSTNIGLICDHHSKQRLDMWQKSNIKTTINKGDVVKLRFEESNKLTEHMWVQVIEVHKNNEFIGTLQNDPKNLSKIKFMDKVKFKRSDIEDHIAY